LLLQHGALIDSKTMDAYTPLHVAVKEGQEEVTKVLLDNGAKQNIKTKVWFNFLTLFQLILLSISKAGISVHYSV